MGNGEDSDALTKREHEVLQLVAQGYSSREIASKLHRSVKTVLAHRNALGRKLGATNRIELVRIAMLRGLVPLPAARSEAHVEYLDELRAQVNRGEQSQRVLRIIDSTLSVVSGDAYFPVLVDCLIRCMHADAAIAVRCPDDTHDEPSVLGFTCTEDLKAKQQDQFMQQLFEYCKGRRRTSGPQCFEMPFDHGGDQRIVGIRLLDGSQRMLGQVAVVLNHHADASLEPQTILRILAARAVAELKQLAHREALADANDMLEQRVDRRTAELRQTMESLRDSEARYRLIIEHQTEFIVQTDLDGRVMYASPGYCRLFGMTEAEMHGQSLWPLIHTDDQSMIRDSLPQLMKQPHLLYVESRAKTVGGWRWFAWNNRALLDEDDRVTSIISAGRDITEQKRIEEALFSTKPGVLEVAEDAVFIIGFDGQVQDINELACERLGYTRDELLHMAVQDFDHEYSSREKVRQIIETIQCVGAITFRSTHIHRDGTPIPIEVTARLLRTGDREHIVALVREQDAEDAVDPTDS